MRRSLAAHTGLAVLLWFFTTPFVHLHSADAEDDRGHEAAGQEHEAIVHFHTPDHHAAELPAEVTASDEDGKPLDSFALVQESVQPLASPFLTVLRFQVMQAVLRVPENVVAAHTPRAHDPPVLRATGPRAPPA